MNPRLMRPVSARLASIAGAASLLALASAGAARAQETQPAPQPAAAEPASTMDIVVTAQFRAQNLQDTPLSITAVNSELLEARSQNDIAAVAQQAPNVTLVPGGGAFGPSLGAAIRGVGQFDFNPAYEPGVGLYVDDVYYATLTGSVLDLLDLDRVEVLRGPQGTLTGRNSIGGAIKLFSKKPNGEGGGYVEAGYGARNRVNLRGSADFTLAENLYARLSGVYKKQDGYIDQIDYGCANPDNPEGIAATRTSGNCLIDKLGETNYVGLRGSIRYNPTDNFDLTISADYTDEKRTNAPEVLTYSDSPSSANYLCGRYCTYASYNAPAEGVTLGQGTPAAATSASNVTTFRGWGVSANMVIGLTDDINLSSITAYRHYKSTFGTDDDFTPDPSISGLGNNRLTFRFFSQELRLNGKIGEWADWTVGGYYSDQKSVYYTQQDIRYIVPGTALQFYGDDPVTADSKAVFGTLIVRPVDGLTLTGGLRYTEESKAYTFYRFNYDGTVNAFLDPIGAANGVGAPGALSGTTANYAGSRVDWRVSADYRISPELLVYGTVSTGFKGGGISARPFNATQALNGSFNPETLTAYEVGIKADLIDRKLRVNLSAFINDYKDVILPLVDCTAFGGGPCGVVTNAGDAQFKGVELEITAQPIEGMMFDAAVSYLHSEWKTLDPRVGASVDLTDPVTTAPEWKWSAGLQYEIPLGTAGSLTPRIDASFTDDRFSGRAIADTPYFLPSWAIANARLTWRNADEDLSISAEVTNIFDDYYFTSRFATVYSFTGTAYNQVGRPREWAVTVRKNF